MKILQKARQFLSLNKELFAAAGAGGGSKGKRFWLYAESLGEFRLALHVVENIKSISAGDKNEPPALFFISFKTYSVLSLAQKTAGQEGGSGDIRYFFHPWPGFAPVLKKYAAAIKPDCFISVQRRVSKKLIKLLSGIGAKTVFLGIDALPMSLKFISCVNAAECGAAGNGAGKGNSGGPVVVSFVSIHKKEAGFILNLAGEIVSGGGSASSPRNSNLKFIFVPRNIKYARGLFKKAAAKGLRPVYYAGGGMDAFLKDASSSSLIVGEYGVTGEVYGASDIVYVGKSLFESEKGGHNVLEPALYGKPVLTGRYAVNFSDIISEMQKRGALILTGETEFRQSIEELIENEELRKETGNRGLDFCMEKGKEFKNHLKSYIAENII